MHLFLSVCPYVCIFACGVHFFPVFDSHAVLIHIHVLIRIFDHVTTFSDH